MQAVNQLKRKRDSTKGATFNFSSTKPSSTKPSALKRRATPSVAYPPATIVHAADLDFERDGACILSDLVSQLPHIQAHVLDFVTNWQLEFKDPTKPLVLGGFGALGTPSSFHAPPIRALNQLMHDVLMPFFMARNPNKYITSMFNRFCIRYPGTSTGNEAPHRDSDPEDGFYYGGWLNTGDQPQKFTCMLGSHHYTAGGAGFHKLAGAELDEYQRHRSTIIIQPGQIIVFKSLKHEIHNTKCVAITSKIWHSFFVSATEDSLLYDPQEIARQLSVPLLPSKQDSPMYALLHYVNWRDRLREFSANIRDDLIDPKTGLVVRFLSTVKNAGVGLPPYTEAEMDRFRTRRLDME